MDKLEGQVCGDYKLGKLIGKGTYGHVYRARRILKNGRATSTVFAVCTIYIIYFFCHNVSADFKVVGRGRGSNTFLMENKPYMQMETENWSNTWSIKPLLHFSSEVAEIWVSVLEVLFK